MASTALPKEWKELDSWWEVFTESTPMVSTSETTRYLDEKFFLGCWEDTDVWWDSYVEDYSLIEVSDNSVDLDKRFIKREWEELDSWWDCHIKSQREEVKNLRQVMNEVQREWEHSNSRFERGPLTSDWKSDQGVTKPLRTYQEENWSQWLAHLLQSAPPSLLTNLFEGEFDRQPSSVEREEYLPNHRGTDRYADVILFYKDKGISVEVKKGDKHYSKTIDTASLIELHHQKEWEHILLLPRQMNTALRQSFPEKLEESKEGRLEIRSEVSEDIKILYWRDISSAIRKGLQSDSASDPHWEASAYVFATLIEQEIAGFAPKPLVDRIANSRDVIQNPISVFRGSIIQDEIEYLRGTMEGQKHE